MRRPVRGLIKSSPAALASAAVMVVLAACGPSHPADPVAVRYAEDEIEVLYTSCSPIEIAEVELLVPRQEDHFLEEGTEPIWEITFDPPALADRFIIGETPQDAQETIPMPEDLTTSTYYAVDLRLESGLVVSAGFTPDELKDNVNYAGRYMSPEQFASETACT